MNIYIGGRVTARERLKPMREVLRMMGHKVSSHWMDVAQDYPAAGVIAEYGRGEENVDLQEIDAAHLVIVDTMDVNPTGGREFEAGYAHGTGTPFVIVGPLRNIFHRHARAHYEAWEELFLKANL